MELQVFMLSVISQFSAIFVIQFSPIKAQKKQPKQVVSLILHSTSFPFSSIFFIEGGVVE